MFENLNQKRADIERDKNVDLMNFDSKKWKFTFNSNSRFLAVSYYDKTGTTLINFRQSAHLQSYFFEVLCL